MDESLVLIEFVLPSTHTHHHKHSPAFPGDVARAFSEVRARAPKLQELHQLIPPSLPPSFLFQDFAQITQHFRLVRTFYAVYYGTEVMPFIAKAGLKAALGVSIGKGGTELYIFPLFHSFSHPFLPRSLPPSLPPSPYS